MKKIVILAIIILLLLNIGQLLYSSFSNRLYIVAVPNEETAIEVGKAVLMAKYGEGILNQEPFSVRYTRILGYWTVSGTRSDGASLEGRVVSVTISKNDGRILRMRV